jgi:hypothetical protein
MVDSFVERIAVFDEWKSGGETFRLMNPGAGPDRLQVLKEENWVDEKSHYEWGVLTNRFKSLLNCKDKI